MKTWLLTDDNDIDLKFGQIQMVEELQALKTRITAALEVVKGEVSDPEMGVDYFGIIFSNTPISMKIQEICRVINSIAGVSKTEFIEARFNKETGALNFRFEIYSEYGSFEYEKTFEKLD